MVKVEKMLSAAQKRMVTIQSDSLLIEAAQLLHRPECNLVVVCNDGRKMEGVVTKTDIVRQVSHCTGRNCTLITSKVMTSNVTYCHPEDCLKDLWSIIKERDLKNVPIVDQNLIPLGVLNARDVLQVLLKDVEYEEHLLRDYVMGIGYR